MPISGSPPAAVHGNLEASAVVARFRALIDARTRQRWSQSEQEAETKAFRQELVRMASPMVVRQSLEQLLRDYPMIVSGRVEADHIPWPWGWRAVVWRTLAADHWTVANAVDFTLSLLASDEGARFRYWESKEAVVFLADFYKESPLVVAFLLEARKFSDFEYVVDVLIRERFSPTEVWTPALSVALHGHRETKSFLLARLAPLLRTHPNIRIVVEDALRASPLSFSIDAWRAYAAGAPEDQDFRAGMEEIVETLIAATVSGLPAYNLLPFDHYMQHYPADEAALRHCMRAVFEGSARLRPLAVDWLGKRFWRSEQTKSALSRVLHESSEPDARSQAFYALMLRFGTDPDLRASLFQVAAAEPAPRSREAMMRVLSGEPIHRIAPRTEPERKCERRLFGSIYALFRKDALCFLSPDDLRRRVDELTDRIEFLNSSIRIAGLLRRAGHDRPDYNEMIIMRQEAECVRRLSVKKPSSRRLC